MTLEDLKGSLILISYDAVSTDDIDHTIDLDNYAVAQTISFDMFGF